MKPSFLFIFLCACTMVNAQPTTTPLKGNYLGQKPPGMKPERFAPGIISTKYYEHGAPAFSPDGKTVLWTVIYERGKPSRIMEMRQENGVWTKPASVAFADTTADDFYPSFSADGKKLYFSSRRKLPDGYPSTPGMIRLWEVEKKSTGWGTPALMDTAIFKPEIYYHSITNNGVIYASRRGPGGSFDIECYKKDGAQYLKPVALPYNINSTASEDGVFIAPDESYLIFESARPGGIEGSTDLYISFRRKDGTWSTAKNMGPDVNSKFTERFARVSPDGKYLFFGSDRDPKPGDEGTDIFWVDAKVIDVLKKEELSEHENSIDKEGKDIMQVAYGNDYPKLVLLLKDWLAAHPKDVNGYIDYFGALRKAGRYADAEKELEKMQGALPNDPDLKAELVLISYGLGKNEDAEKILATIPAQTTGDRSRYIVMGTELNSMKKYKESATLYEIALKIQPRAIDFYNLACSYALQGDKDKAFEALNKAADGGYKEKERIESDSDLQSLLADPGWTKLQEKLVSALPPEDPKRPYKRAHHEMVYNNAEKSVLMISGSTPLSGGQYGIFFNDIWQYNNSGWSKVGVAGDKRSGIRLAYDTKHNKLYSFGGFTGDNQSSGQLRVWENKEWRVLTDLPDMKAAESGFVYDVKRDKFIAFGGSASRGVANGITWEWDGNSWKKLDIISPAARQAFAMVYDSKRNKTVLFGGTYENGKMCDDGVWEFDETEWKNIPAAIAPGPRISPGYAYDSKRGMLVIFGGLSPGGMKGDTWGWDGTEWKKLTDTGPAPRMMGYMAYDKGRDKIVLFGGRTGWPNDAGDTWEWDGNKWNEIK